MKDEFREGGQCAPHGIRPADRSISNEIVLPRRQSPRIPTNIPRIGLLIAVKQPIVNTHVTGDINERPAPSCRCFHGLGSQGEGSCWNSWSMNRSSSDSKRAERSGI